MPSSNGDDFQDFAEHEFSAEVEPQEFGAAEETETEPELEVGPRAERPNFLTATRFVDFDLPPEIMEGLDNAGFEYCTPIQAQAIPVALEGLDIAGQAQTGTGKTTAFLVPLLNRLMKNKPLEPGMPRAIIITPTRELALQIYEDARVLAQNTNLKQVLVIGGMEYREQADVLRTAPEIIICTPGRVIDYIQQGVFKTRGIEVAVVDEADRLLDMGFIKDLKIILSKLPPFTSRQTMLFSATLDDRVLELTYQYMNPPQYITAEPDKSTKVNIEQELYHIGRDEKLSLLLGLLRREEHQRVIIFSNTKSGVEWIAKKLTMNGFQAEGITGDLPQPKRLKLMEAFKENRLQILVATDVASRGIHVDDVSHVYNYDLPQDAENYIHRIGRTARAGHSGKAVSFGCEDYVFHLEAIENLLGEKIPVVWPDAEWFQEDQGGEVRLKDRRGGDRDKRRDRDGGRGHGEGRREGREGQGGGGAPRVSRGPAKSQRAGGIFGLAPRLSSSNGLDGARQTLDWSLEEAPVIDAEILEISAAMEAMPALEGQEKESANGRRRNKRRRNKRGRGEGGEMRGATQEEMAAKSEAAQTQATKAEATRTEEPAKKSPRKPRQSAAPKAAPAAPLAEAVAAGAAPALEKTAPAKRGRPKAVPQPAKEEDRYPKKRVSGTVAAEPEAPKPVAAASAPPAAAAAIVPAPAGEKPKRGRPPKKVEEKLEAVAVAPKPKRAAAPKAAAQKSEPVEAAPKPKRAVAAKATVKTVAEKPAAPKRTAAKKESAAAPVAVAEKPKAAPVKKATVTKKVAEPKLKQAPAKPPAAAKKTATAAKPKAAAAPVKKAPVATARAKAAPAEKKAVTPPPAAKTAGRKKKTEAAE